MNSELLPFWELVLDGIQIFLCAMIFLFLIHNKIKHKRWILTATPAKETIAFSDEIHLQHLKQLTEKCFDTVIDTINRERLDLQTHFDGDPSGSETHGSVLPASDELKTVLAGDQKGPGDTEFANFSKIIALAEKGLSIREISQQMNMPSGEVELVVRLNKDDVEDKHSHVLRAKV